MRCLLLLLCCLPFFACAIVIRHDVSDEKYKVQKNTIPQLATFYFDGAHGTLIEPSWIITAAHATFCVIPSSTILINENLVTVEKVFIHKDYQPGKSHDIALIKLREPVADVIPFAINTDSNELDKNLWFIGIGGTGNGLTGQTVDNYENKGQMRKAQNSVTYAKGPVLKFEFDKGSEALPLEGVSGGGDSGGPAYRFQDKLGVVYGISSRVEGGDIGKYGVNEVYSRTSYFASWIQQIISGANTKDISHERLQQLPAGLTEDMLPHVCEDISIDEGDI